MKILQVIPAVAPRYGGPSQAIVEMSRALTRRGHEVLIAATDVDGGGRLRVPVGTEVEHRSVPAIFFRGIGERFNYSPGLAAWLATNVAKFDLVHIHAVFSHPCLAASRWCRKQGVPYVVRPLGSLDPWSMAQKPLRKQLMWRMAAERMLREAASIHYTTDEEKRSAESSLSLEGGVVIPLGVVVDEDEASRSGFRELNAALGDKPYILSLSRIHPKKNIETLIESFLELARRPELDDWRLVIAGEGASRYVAKLRARADMLGGRTKVWFAGWIEGSIKASAIQQASLFASPSLQENFGIAVAEALAFGVPVVVSEHVNLAPEIARAGAGWVIPLAAGELSRALGEAMINVEERERRGRAGRQFVERRLSWAGTARELEGLYGSIAAGRPRIRSTAFVERATG